MVKHDYEHISEIRAERKRKYRTWIASGGVFIAAMVLYLKTMAPSILWGDSAAFATTSYILGLPHSPSFPLYTMLGRVFSLIPGLTPAAGANVMSAFFAALSVVLFCALVRRLVDLPVFQPRVYKKLLMQRRQAMQNSYEKDEPQGPKPNIEAMAQPNYVLYPVLAVTALFALSLPVWLAAVRAEVYSLHLAMTLLAVYLLLMGNRDNQIRYYFLGFWVYALSFANHPLLALSLAPAFIYLFFQGFLLMERRLATLFGVSICFLAGLSLYLYLPVRSLLEPPINWGRPGDLAALWEALTRSASLSGLSEMTRSPDYMARLKQAGLFLSGQIGWPLIVLVPPALWGIRRISRKAFWFLLLALPGSLAVVLWSAEFNPRNYDLISYLAPLLALILITTVAGIMYIMRMWLRTSSAVTFMTVLIAAFVGVAAMDNIPRADMASVTAPDVISRKALENVAPGSIIMAAEDDFLLPMWYRAYADSTARHMKIMSPGAMVNYAYRRQLMVNYPDLSYPPGFADRRPGIPDSLALQLCRLNAPERDIYIQFGVPGISHQRLIPDGLLYRYVPPGETVKPTGGNYKNHLALVDEMLAGNSSEASTIEFCGRWLFSQGIYYQRHDIDDIAWTFFKIALDVDRESVALRKNLAIGLAKAGNYKEALRYVSQVLEIDSRDEEALRLGKEIIKKLDAAREVAGK